MSLRAPTKIALGFEPTGLTFPGNTPYDAWEDVLEWLDVVGRGHAWWIADAINWGAETFGEKAPQGFSKLGFAEQTLMNWAWVGRAIPRARRHGGLEFGHHALVAALDPPEQDRWLDVAEAGEILPNGERRRWSVSRLRTELRSAKEREAPVTAADALAICQEELARLREGGDNR